MNEWIKILFEIALLLVLTLAILGSVSLIVLLLLEVKDFVRWNLVYKIKYWFRKDKRKPTSD